MALPSEPPPARWWRAGLRNGAVLVLLLAVAVDGVPIDVLAERLDSTRGALYKTVHDARAKLRAALEER